MLARDAFSRVGRCGSNRNEADRDSGDEGHVQVSSAAISGMDIVVATQIDMLFRFVTVFGEIATADPISAVLLLFGAVITVLSSAFFGLLVAGAALDAFGGGFSGLGRSPPPGAK
jgi:hypothetical protein